MRSWIGSGVAGRGLSHTLFTFALSACLLAPRPAAAQRQVERLDRGVVAMHGSQGEVYVGWRMLGSDPDDIGFNVYRAAKDGEAVKLNDQPLTDSTNFVDASADLAQPNTYLVRSVVNGKEQPGSDRYALPANPPVQNYISIPLRGSYAFNAVGVGDLNGDGALDYVIKQPNQVSDPGKFKPSEEPWKIEAYTSDGRFLWQNDLGANITQGIWWSPMVVYDLDGDGKAEVITRTAPKDTDFRDPTGRVLTGPEWFSIFDGETGAERAKGDWIPRGDISDWGDDYGNRVDRHQIMVAYLDGQRPSLLVFRGTYGLMKAEVWSYRDGRLTRLWAWSNEGLGTEYQGQGYHEVRVFDLDGDGKDEILNGALAIDDDGTTMWTTGEGHGDRFHLTDIDPERPGLEIFYVQETKKVYKHPMHLRDARTGELIWGPSAAEGEYTDVGRGLVADIDPRHNGLEAWARGGGAKYLFNAKGEVIGRNLPPCHFAVWWDGDLLRELVENGNIFKWDPGSEEAKLIGTHVLETYSEKMVADVFGDWREEIVTHVPGELRIYTTTIPSKHRFRTLLHDPLYRLDTAAWSNGYKQSAHPSFFLGEGMQTPSRPPLTTAQTAP